MSLLTNTARGRYIKIRISSAKLDNIYYMVILTTATLPNTHKSVKHYIKPRNLISAFQITESLSSISAINNNFTAKSWHFCKNGDWALRVVWSLKPRKLFKKADYSSESTMRASTIRSFISPRKYLPNIESVLQMYPLSAVSTIRCIHYPLYPLSAVSPIRCISISSIDSGYM